VLPSVIGHADWGSTPGKRQLALARLAAAGPGGRPGYQVVWLAAVPEPVAGGAGPLAELAGGAGPGPAVRAGPGGPALLGFDFPIGLPRAYAAAAGIGCFPRFLDGLGSPPWERFAEVAADASEVTLYRPFYPARPGGSSRDRLYQALGLTAGQLRRRCEQADAEITFWTLGPRQAGKAALHGWRLLQRARQETKAVLWPFEGPLAGLLASGAHMVVAETYPREYYRYLGSPPHRPRWSKRRQADRLARVPGLLAWADSLRVSWDPAVGRRVRAGFASGPCGEDEFDAMVGLLAMIAVVTGAIPAGEPREDPAVTAVEGWILGRAG
jgi:hypothetical protein